MLIIFDLDDTLVDTSGCITYHTLGYALQAMQEAGLVLEDFEGALELLRRLDRVAASAREALSEFLEILGAEPQFFAIGMQKIYEQFPLDLPLYPLKGAVDILLELSIQHELALVSNGILIRQMEKLKKAGIDSRFFSRIAVSEDRNKGPRYQEIVEGLKYPPYEVLVCGDRIAVDLAPARAAGYRTVHLRWGRGKECIGQEECVDYTIHNLQELKGIISGMWHFKKET